MALSKPSLRSLMKTQLKEVTSNEIKRQSTTLFRKIVDEMNVVSSDSVLCIFISMNNEIDTSDMIHHFLTCGHKLYIPKVTGKLPQDMVMYPVKNIEELQNFPKNKWGIPEPPLDLLNNANIDNCADIDVVFMPGVAFDKKCNRIGHGRGYYDSFVTRLAAKRSQQGLPEPKLIGLSLLEQIIEELPIEPHDKALDFVVTAEHVFHPSEKQTTIF